MIYNSVTILRCFFFRRNLFSFTQDKVFSLHQLCSYTTVLHKQNHFTNKNKTTNKPPCIFEGQICVARPSMYHTNAMQAFNKRLAWMELLQDLNCKKNLRP